MESAVAIGWLAAFKAIPWAEVIEAAPTVVHTAKGLWTRAQPERVAQEPVEASSRELAARLAEAQHRVWELEQHQIASSELIQALAEQNATLVEAVEILRLRTRGLMIGGALLTFAVLALAGWQLAS